MLVSCTFPECFAEALPPPANTTLPLVSLIWRSSVPNNVTKSGPLFALTIVKREQSHGDAQVVRSRLPWSPKAKLTFPFFSFVIFRSIPACVAPRFAWTPHYTSYDTALPLLLLQASVESQVAEPEREDDRFEKIPKRAQAKG